MLRLAFISIYPINLGFLRVTNTMDLTVTSLLCMLTGSLKLFHWIFLPRTNNGNHRKMLGPLWSQARIHCIATTQWEKSFTLTTQSHSRYRPFSSETADIKGFLWKGSVLPYYRNGLNVVNFAEWNRSKATEPYPRLSFRRFLCVIIVHNPSLLSLVSLYMYRLWE